MMIVEKPGFTNVRRTKNWQQTEGLDARVSRDAPGSHLLIAMVHQQCYNRPSYHNVAIGAYIFQSGSAQKRHCECPTFEPQNIDSVGQRLPMMLTGALRMGQ